MAPVEHDQEHAAARGKAEDPLRAETVWLEEPIFERAHLFNLVFVAAVEGRKVEIRRCQVDIIVCRRLSGDEYSVSECSVRG